MNDKQQTIPGTRVDGIHRWHEEYVLEVTDSELVFIPREVLYRMLNQFDYAVRRKRKRLWVARATPRPHATAASDTPRLTTVYRDIGVHGPGPGGVNPPARHFEKHNQ